MAMNLSTEVRMIKGVGPQRAELLAQRGIHTLEDLLGYLPFRYEDRMHFSKVKDIQPHGSQPAAHFRRWTEAIPVARVFWIASTHAGQMPSVFN